MQVTSPVAIYFLWLWLLFCDYGNCSAIYDETCSVIYGVIDDETRALRAHTPRAPSICIIVQLGHMLSMTFTYTYEASAHEQIYMHNA